MKLRSSFLASPRQVAALALGLVASTAGYVGAQAPGRRSARDVHLKIETDRTTYRVGDAISVRLTVRNVSGSPVRFVHTPPVSQVRLRVLDSDGHEVTPTSEPVLQVGRSGRPVTLDPGKAQVLAWLGHEWLNLRDWGYELRIPGHYTLVGLPAVGGVELTPDLQTIRSNRANFTVMH